MRRGVAEGGSKGVSSVSLNKSELIIEFSTLNSLCLLSSVNFMSLSLCLAEGCLGICLCPYVCP